MAQLITDGNFEAAIAASATAQQIGEAYIFDEGVSFTGDSVRSDFVLITGPPTGSTDGGAGTTSYFTGTDPTINWTNFTWIIKMNTTADPQTGNRNHTLRGGGGVTMARGKIIVVGTALGQRVGFGSPTADTQLLTVDDLVLQAQNVRLIAQLGGFAVASTLAGFALDDATYEADGATADYNVKSGARYNGALTGVFSKTGAGVTDNGNLSGQGQVGVSGTTTFDGAVIQRNESTTVPGNPNDQLFISPKSTYFTFIDTVYSLRNSSGVYSPGVVETSVDVNDWIRFRSSSDGAAGQPAQEGTGMLIGRRFQVNATDATGAVIPRMETYITNPEGNAFNTTNVYAVATDISTGNPTPDASGRPVQEQQVLANAYSETDAVVIGSDEVDFVPLSDVQASFGHTINDRGNFGYKTRRYGYAPIDRINVSSRLIEPVTNEALTAYPWVIREGIAGVNNSVNEAASQAHNIINQAPLSDHPFTVSGSVLNGNSDLDITIGGVIEGFTVNAGRDLMGFSAQPVLETFAISEPNLVPLVILDEITLPLLNGDLAANGTIRVDADATTGTVAMRGHIRIGDGDVISNFINQRVAGRLTNWRDDQGINNTILIGDTRIDFELPGDTYTFLALFGVDGIDIVGNTLDMHTTNPITIVLSPAESVSLGRSGSVGTTITNEITFVVENPEVLGPIKPFGSFTDLTGVGGFFGIYNVTTNTDVLAPVNLSSITNLDQATALRSNRTTDEWRAYYKPTSGFGTDRLVYFTTFETITGDASAGLDIRPTIVFDGLVGGSTTEPFPGKFSTSTEDFTAIGSVLETNAFVVAVDDSGDNGVFTPAESQAGFIEAANSLDYFNALFNRRLTQDLVIWEPDNTTTWRTALAGYGVVSGATGGAQQFVGNTGGIRSRDPNLFAEVVNQQSANATLGIVQQAIEEVFDAEALFNKQDGANLGNTGQVFQGGAPITPDTTV